VLVILRGAVVLDGRECSALARLLGAQVRRAGGADRETLALVEEIAVVGRAWRAAIERIGLDDPEAGRLIRLVGAFLRSQVASVAVVDKALRTPVEAASSAEDTRAQDSVSDKVASEDAAEAQGSLLPAEELP
jgi:hypothetical protein